MLNLTQQTLNKIKSFLLRQQKQVDEQIKSIEQDDPLLLQTAVESSEPGTDSWRADVHNRVVTIKNDLVNFSKNIASALTQINKGTYGKCTKCGKAIKSERLEAMPAATLCVSCSKKTPKTV